MTAFVSLEGYYSKALIDTGAGFSIIHEDIFNKLKDVYGLKLLPTKRVINGVVDSSTIKCIGRVRLHLTLGNKKRRMIFEVVKISEYQF